MSTSPPPVEQSAEQILRNRFARREIDEASYRELAAVLRASSPPRRRRPAPFWAPGVVGALLLLGGLVGTVVGTGAAEGLLMGNPTCNVPALTGRVVDVRLWDMMGGGTMQAAGMMGGRMMAVNSSPSSVPAGEVSFRVQNAGGMVHELVVLPLAAGQVIGTRPVGFDGTVSETGSLGEASRSCGNGAGNGIVPGAKAWVTLRLPPGRYELICNLRGHYAMGMYTELEVD